MRQGRKEFGKVRPRERGKGWRIDVRPFGFLYTVSGEHFRRKRDAEFVLGVIQADIRAGKPPADAVARFQPLASKPNLVTHRYAEWLAVKEREVRAGELKPRTAAEYRRYAAEVERFWSGQTLSDVTTGDLREWLTTMAERGLGAKTRRNVLGALRAMLGWARGKRLLAQVPECPKVEVKDKDRRPVVLIDAEDQDAVLAAIPWPARGAFLAMALMGLRPGEVRALEANDVVEGVLRVSKAMNSAAAGAEVGATKTGATRSVPLAEELDAWLRDHPRIAGPLFVNPRTGKRWSHWALRDTWLRACKAAGLEPVPLYSGTKHSMATDAIRRGVQERYVQEVLGHADVRSTRRYAKSGDEQLREVVRRRNR